MSVRDRGVSWVRADWPMKAPKKADKRIKKISRQEVHDDLCDLIDDLVGNKQTHREMKFLSFEHVTVSLMLSMVYEFGVSAVTTPSKSWDFRGCSSSVITDSISGLEATISSYNDQSTCTTDGLYMNGNEWSYVYIADSWTWDGTTGASWELFVNVEALGFWFRFFDFGNSYPWYDTVHLSAYDTTNSLFFDGRFSNILYLSQRTKINLVFPGLSYVYIVYFI